MVPASKSTCLTSASAASGADALASDTATDIVNIVGTNPASANAHTRASSSSRNGLAVAAGGPCWILAPTTDAG